MREREKERGRKRTQLSECIRMLVETPLKVIPMLLALLTTEFSVRSMKMSEGRMRRLDRQ